MVFATIINDKYISTFPAPRTCNLPIAALRLPRGAYLRIGELPAIPQIHLPRMSVYSLCVCACVWQNTKWRIQSEDGRGRGKRKYIAPIKREGGRVGSPYM